jgi:23S rRNA (cytosine1962-C5)-methyltransferase
MIIWHLKKGSERKFRSGHPWVFSNELAQSPKGITAGELIELRDHSGGFLARGYGHPNSLIAFRTLALSSKDSIDAAFFQRRFERADRLRSTGGVGEFSHRFCFAEGDHVPGLVIDRYMLDNRGSHLREASAQVFVIQASTSGADRLLPQILEGLECFVRAKAQKNDQKNDQINDQINDQSLPWEKTAVIIANDSKSRLMEGLVVEPKKVVTSFADFTPHAAKILIQPSLDDLKPLVFDADLLGGQKTGFFLDQRFNVQITARIVRELLKTRRRPLRVLDLFCYVGQWGTQLAHLASSMGVKAEVTLVDASSQALELASANVERHGGHAIPEKRDIVAEISKFQDGAYDVVICDPPAFVKKKKDLPTGGPAYFKLNREAIRKTASGGVFVSCSCSGLFTEEDFRTMLGRVSSTFGDRPRWIARGSHSPDHPQRPEFPQGTYLKSWIGVIE